MKPQYLVPIVACLLLVGVSFHQVYFTASPLNETAPDFYVGIDVANNDIPKIKELVSELKNYTNLFIIGCTGITYKEDRLDETCQYLYDQEINFVIYSERSPQARWIESAKNRWGSRFLGFYAFDEPGGKQLDQVRPVFRTAENITDASNKFVEGVNKGITWFSQSFTNSVQPTLFTSDYALYWFDYEGGYDVLLAQFGWNLSRQLNIALCRGAATIHDKDWGMIVTWTYNHLPHIGSGEELYNDLVLAYDNGAKYLTVFDSNEWYTETILQQEHLEAIKQFWNYTQQNPRSLETTEGRVAFVLPKDYAYGFRGPKDKIWGIWEADDFSFELSSKFGALLEQYDTKLDVIYDKGLTDKNTLVYDKLIFWNGTERTTG